MKTSILLIIAAILLMVSPAFAEKNKPCPMDANSGKRSSAKHRTLNFNSSKSAHHIRKKNKGFETPKNHLSKWKKNPNKTKSQFRDGGFFSFRRHNYSAHIFHNH
jgi:Ni/Co efflux regulator RcnB